MWKLELEDSYFKIYDDRKTIVGYFAPEYGEIYPEDRADQIIQEMLKRHDKIKGGYMMLPLVKFGIFEEGKEMNLDYIQKQLVEANNRLALWKNLMVKIAIMHHKVLVSHTDHDMLSITLDIIFASPVSLEKNDLQNELGQILDLGHQMGLL